MTSAVRPFGDRAFLVSVADVSPSASAGRGGRAGLPGGDGPGRDGRGARGARQCRGGQRSGRGGRRPPGRVARRARRSCRRRVGDRRTGRARPRPRTRPTDRRHPGRVRRSRPDHGGRHHRGLPVRRGRPADRLRSRGGPSRLRPRLSVSGRAPARAGRHPAPGDAPALGAGRVGGHRRRVRLDLSEVLTRRLDGSRAYLDPPVRSRPSSLRPPAARRHGAVLGRRHRGRQ